MEYKQLFSPFKIGNCKIQNRIVMTPMEIDLAKFNGKASKEVINYYYERAKGGCGLLITGITRVNDLNGVSTPRQLSLSHNSTVPSLKKLTDKIHTTESKIFTQLHHPGRQNFSAMINNWPLMKMTAALIPGFKYLFGPLVKFYTALLDKTYTPSVVAPSSIPCQHLKQKTRALREHEIKKLIKQFGKAAKRAQKANFDGVEIHASHGYLIQQFLSPRTNKRTDEYGGSLENRFRFLKEIIEIIRVQCGSDFPISVRLTVEEYYENEQGDEKGIVLKEGLKIAKLLELLSIDLINVSSATYETMNKWLEPVTYEPGWRKNLAAEVKKVVSTPVLAANLIRSPQQAEDQLNAGIQDLIGLGRPTIADPAWANKVKSGNEEAINNCINCLNCFESLNKNAWYAKSLECAVNPLFGHESDVNKIPFDSKGKRAIVVGAGVAGLRAAIILSKRGFEVIVLEKAQKAGGQVNLAAVPPNKKRIALVIKDSLFKLKVLGVEIKYGITATKETIATLKPDKIILAAGSIPFMPPIVGKELNHVHSVNDVLNGKVSLKGRSILVAGSGLTGLETAEYLAEKGNQVTVIEMMDRIGPSAYHQNLQDVLEHLEHYNVKFLTSVRLDRIAIDHVILQDQKKQNDIRLEVEDVVLSIGNRKNNSLKHDLELLCDDVAVVGDSSSLGKISDAIKSGFEAALK